jgi:hypothetical protein
VTTVNPDDTLGMIDDVLTDWCGSADAMVWTAEPPPVYVPASRLAPGTGAAPEAGAPAGRHTARG